MNVNPSGSAGAEASHLSIGEVLNILREEFPDVTISKIRFLESQGLIDPERTPSGYRKFYESDVSRLRWILHQQKENFLPLKVIKERLDRMGEEQPASVHAIARAQPRARRAPSRQARRSENLAPQLPLGDPMPASPAEEELAPAADNGDRASVRDAPSPPRKRSRPVRREETAPETREEPGRARSATGNPGLTRGELERAAGLEDWQLNELESFGLLEPVEYDGGEALFDDDGQAIATAAAGFYAHGIGARHLRMYKHFAEREATLFQQVALQYLRQRNPEARAKAREELATLSKLGRALRSALLVQAVRDSIAE
ncbi:MAG TPA: MerR family transcriptional regulator [Acidimicrobiia bacterium]|nr:MerR family transcriptional regulator [Acidimicrobiia bacterium]